MKRCRLLWNYPPPDAVSFAAGDSVCHASLPQPLQRPGQRGLPAGRAQCPNHHRECGMLVWGVKDGAGSATACTHPLLPQALYDYVPSTSDLQPLLTWLSTMERAHVNLGRCGQELCLGRGERRPLGLSPALSLCSRLQKDLCWAHLPRLFSAAMNCFLSPHSQVVSAAAQTLEVPCMGAAPCLAALVLTGGCALRVWGLPGDGVFLCACQAGGSVVHCHSIFCVCPCRPS